MFSKIDLRSRYHQVQVRDNDIQKIAFRIRYCNTPNFSGVLYLRILGIYFFFFFTPRPSIYDIQFLKILISPSQPIKPKNQIAKTSDFIKNVEVKSNLIWYITIRIYLSRKKSFKTSTKYIT